MLFIYTITYCCCSFSAQAVGNVARLAVRTSNVSLHTTLIFVCNDRANTKVGLCWSFFCLHQPIAKIYIPHISRSSTRRVHDNRRRSTPCNSVAVAIVELNRAERCGQTKSTVRMQREDLFVVSSEDASPVYRHAETHCSTSGRCQLATCSLATDSHAPSTSLRVQSRGGAARLKMEV